MTSMSILLSGPQERLLYTRTSSGKLATWRAWSEGEKVYFEWGEEGGALQVASYTATPKGKYSASEQACREVDARYRKQLKKDYYATRDEVPAGASDQPLIPMKAKEYDKNRKKVSYPCDMQPKLDGVRCTYRDGKIWSYGMKEYQLPHVVKALQSLKIPKGVVLDGELYCHGLPLQQIISLAKRPRKESEQLQYHIFDAILVGEDLTWDDRLSLLQSIFASGVPSGLADVPVVQVDNEEQLEQVWLGWATDGYEGAIVRNLGGVYRWNYRSSDLLKVKRFQDSEFLCSGIREDKNGRAVFTCESVGGKFSCSIKGTHEEQVAFVRDKNQWIGEMLKVKYLYLSDSGIPILPRGLAFRPEDI